MEKCSGFDVVIKITQQSEIHIRISQFKLVFDKGARVIVQRMTNGGANMYIWPVGLVPTLRFGREAYTFVPDSKQNPFGP